MLKSRRCDIGRYINGDIDHQLWFAVQNSDAADRFGVIGVQPQELYYYFSEEDLPSILEELKSITSSLSINLILLHKFFEENTGYTDEKVAEYLGVELDDAQKMLKDYADFLLGSKIANAVQTGGQCEFTAEL